MRLFYTVYKNATTVPFCLSYQYGACADGNKTDGPSYHIEIM